MMAFVGRAFRRGRDYVKLLYTDYSTVLVRVNDACEGITLCRRMLRKMHDEDHNAFLFNSCGDVAFASLDVAQNFVGYSKLREVWLV